MDPKSLLFIAFILISADGNEAFMKCTLNDNQCLKELVQQLLRSTCDGNSEWGVNPTDPLIIPSLYIDATKEAGLVFHYKNLNVAGFKNLQLTENNLNSETLVEAMKIQVDLTIVGDIEIEIANVQKTFKGPYSATATFIGSIEYAISLKEVDGKQYFIAGPETITSKTSGETTATVGDDLRDALDKDEDAVKLKPQWKSNNASIREKILTTIANHGFTTIAGNLRALGNTFDKTVFLKSE